MSPWQPVPLAMPWGFEINWLVQENEAQIEYHLDELTNIIFYGLVSEKRSANA